MPKLHYNRTQLKQQISLPKPLKFEIEKHNPIVKKDKYGWNILSKKHRRERKNKKTRLNVLNN